MYALHVCFFFTQIRRCAIKCLPNLCKGPDEALLCTKVADVLTQLLVSGEEEHCCRILSYMYMYTVYMYESTTVRYTRYMYTCI